MGDRLDSPDYIPVGGLSVGFSENALPPTGLLAGKEIELFCESGKKTSIAFINPEILTWETVDGCRKERFVAFYTAITPREGVFFVDFILSYGDSKSVSIVLDMERACATIVTGIMPTAEEVMVPLIVRAEKGMPLTSVQVLFERAAIDARFCGTTPCHRETRDLVGERIQWVYSSKDAYEHVYLNENTYSWHCIAGNEKGLADTDRCYFYKIGEQLYLFVWIEKIVPTVGVVLEDLAIMRSYGKIFGHEDYDMNGRITNFAVGSYGRLLNRTEYDFSPLSAI